MKKNIIIVNFDENKHQISYREQTGEVTWQTGVPTTSFASKKFSGKMVSIKKGAAWGIKENLQPGQLYSFDFATSRIKKPILDIIIQSGWTIKKGFLEKILGI